MHYAVGSWRDGSCVLNRLQEVEARVDAEVSVKGGCAWSEKGGSRAERSIHHRAVVSSDAGMRSGASAVQHLLSQAALGVLKHAVTEARRRGHPQVQPLHVVSMLLTHAGSRLRQACMLSHPQNAQTAECRALEVCFNVALDHLPQSAMAAANQPILSNALMAALKRAHAHQRRGCPEHQHSPLLAVKVEIDQLIISILDDPCVSRVMKEAGFSSTNVKCNLEDGPASTVTIPTGALHNLTHEPPQPTKQAVDIAPKGGSFYDNVAEEENETESSVKMASGVMSQATSSWQQSEISLESERREAILRATTRGSHVVLPCREDDIRNVVEILLSPLNRNAILIGDTIQGANCVVDDLAFRIKSGAVPAHLQGLQFLDPKLSLSSFSYCSSLEMEQKLAELSKIVDECMPAGAILHIGDLQWLAEPMQLKKGPSNFCPAQRTATELRNLLMQHVKNRLWFVGVVTPHTFTRLQVLYPSLAKDLKLQPVQVTSTFQPPQPTFLQRFSSNLQAVSVQQTLNSLPVQGSSSIVTSVVQDSRYPVVTQRFQCCSDCTSKFEEERLQIHENESLSLQLAPISWLPSNDEATSGCADGAMSQTRNPSVVQQLAQLQQKWQKYCTTQHGEPTLVSSRLQLQSPRSRLSTSFHSKPCGLGLDMPSQWSSVPDRHLGSSVVDQPLRTPPMFLHPARDQTARDQSPAAVAALAQQVQEAVAGNAKSAAEASPAPEFISPRDEAAPGDRHDDPKGAAPTQSDASQIHTSLGLGRASSGGGLIASKLTGLPALKLLSQQQAPPSPLQSQRASPLKSLGVSPLKSVSSVTSVGASPMASLKGSNGRPAWQTQSPLQSLQQRRPVATMNATAMPWQSSPSLLGRRQVDITKSPSPPPVQEVTVDDNLKGLYKGLMQRVPWQAAAIAGISATVMKCRSRNAGYRGQTAKTDTWLLLLGPDAVAKQWIAKALAELVFGGERSLIHLGFADGSRAKLEADDSGVRFRARTPLDRLAEAVRLKPSAVILLEDVDKADAMMRSRFVKAMEIGKLSDSNGREVSFGNTIVVMTSSVGTDVKARTGSLSFSEAKLAAVVGRAGIRGKIKDSRNEKVVYKALDTKVVVVDYEPQQQLQQQEPREASPIYHSPVGSQLPHWVQKRKPASLLSVELKHDEKRTRSTNGRFLNLDLKLSTGDGNCWSAENQSSSSSSSDHCSPDCEEGDEQCQLLAKARSALSEKLCALPDYAVGFEPYDFTSLATEILTKLGTALEIHGPREVALEVDLQLLEYLITCVWKIPGGRQAFNSWLEDVFVASLDDSRLCGGASVVELLLADVGSELGNDAGVAFPGRVLFDST